MLERPKPKPGKLAMWDENADRLGTQNQAPPAPPPFEPDERDLPPRPTKSVSKLQAAHRKVEELASVVRDEAFDDWVRRYLKPAVDGSEWTQSTLLYENYCKQARLYGDSASRRAVAKQVLASQTQWGKMMGSVFEKGRKRGGYFYPVKLQHGA